jgi:hypothetical protein
MGELINAAVSIKDPFTFFAFLAVIVLWLQNEDSSGGGLQAGATGCQPPRDDSAARPPARVVVHASSVDPDGGQLRSKSRAHFEKG